MAIIKILILKLFLINLVNNYEFIDRMINNIDSENKIYINSLKYFLS